MATIKAIEAKSVHQIQSGQVIVDLCSVVKELVENSLDAEATILEVTFKNNGLDAIEVKDNGAGIAPSNYASVALKHHTSKLSTYDDLSSLNTFGFRGEALSSLCALSNFSITTAQANEVPKGNRLDFEVSGALKRTTTVASQKGTTVSVESLFEKLPVRRKELAKNIKREYGKVLSLLHAYACIGINVKFTVKNAMPKAKSMVVFSTRGNATTRENIANVYGAKTLSALVALDLQLDFQPTLTQMSRDDAHITTVCVRGHISKPVFGDGRQTPDRQMFFVNGRPCGLPQIAKAINEVYKSFNVSQSPFIFADFIMDTNAYDVNVSPDKRTILLHNAANLIERLKVCLTEMFDKQEQTVPQSQVQTSKLPAFKHLSVQRRESNETQSSDGSRPESRSAITSALTDDSNVLNDGGADQTGSNRLFHDHFRNQASTREEEDEDAREKSEEKLQKKREKQAVKDAQAVAREEAMKKDVDEYDDVRELQVQKSPKHEEPPSPHAIRVRDFNARIAEQQRPRPSEREEEVIEVPIASIAPVAEKDSSGIVQNAFDRMRPNRVPAQIATITIDGETTTQIIGTQLPKLGNERKQSSATPKQGALKETTSLSKFSQSLRKFGGPATQTADSEIQDVDEDENEPESDQQSPRSATESASTMSGDLREEGEAVNDQDDAASSASAKHSDDDKESDQDYIDEAAKKAEEEARVAELIRSAEESASVPSKENLRRLNKTLNVGTTKDSTTSLLTTVDCSLAKLQVQMKDLRRAMDARALQTGREEEDEKSAQDEEARLSLTVSKDDFPAMEIAGQFNLGFILATRRAASQADQQRPSHTSHSKDELFIVDQHASDEKFNFERLQTETIIDNQRMVQPVTLNLTAVEEEIVLENTFALEKNGFIVEIDTTGTSPVGRRVTLLSLPISREVTFDTRDLDELLHLLSETPMLGPDSVVPRPSRVRKMFAMRACRSSVMIGKTLNKRQMQKIVGNMGTMEKPWNCPHGRPTMRHLTTLDGLGAWDEDVLVRTTEEGPDEYDRRSKGEVWREYLTS